MNDCPNAVIRDQLPDLLHERLDPMARAAATAHVAECADCRDELELLRGMHGMFVARAPRVDVGAIVAALPKAPSTTARAIRPLRPRRTWSDWRIAAAVTLLVAGGSSVALYRHAPVDPSAIAASSTLDTNAQTPIANSVASVATTSQVAMITPEEGAEAAPAAASAAAEMDDRQLQSLLEDINRLEATPITEPDPVSLRVTARTATPANGRGSE